MTAEESYTFMILFLKGLGLFALAIVILIILAFSHVPDYPDDDGESM